ncbi:MAG: CDP-archaeol synthase [Candidatus Pacebacteria bacterium]|nr:CDP-archaeol synthase [Candidatus Paceibacterota bacterium]
MDYLLYILACIYFFLPAYMANGAPPLIANGTKALAKLATPIDGRKQFFGAPLLGNHKTWRGLVVELLVGTGYFQIFYFIHEYYKLGLYETIGFEQNLLNPLIFGLLLSIGTVFGDLLFAFIKRRIRIKPGESFMPFDQTNYVIGTFLIIQPLYNFQIQFWITLFILTFIIHVTFNRIGYNMGLHKAKW